MNSESRRELIIKTLKENDNSISAGVLAKLCNVTRQIIVADIALLRASGHRIVADNKGYRLQFVKEECMKRVIVKHGRDDVSNEFYAVIDNGGKVLDVIVDHSIYGKISVELNISSRYEADEFVSKLDKTNANPLSLLTEGVHIHTIEVPNEEAFLRIKTALTNLHILVED